MKKFFLFFLLLPLLAQAQIDYALRLRAFGQRIPQEEVFVHMDNTCYYLGDTIFYKVYNRLSTGRPSKLSGLLYVELLNQDGYLVERQKVEMKGGMGHGSIALRDTLYGGYYELRAYTRWQLNWGLYEHPHSRQAEEWFFNKQMAWEYYRDYEKLYSRVFPVFAKPTVPGSYEENMPTRHLSRYFRHTTPVPKANITFYPEGGSLVAGTRQRVAFQADDDHSGEHLKGTLTVHDRQGREVAKASTASRGRGSFELDVEAGQGYTATFHWADHSTSSPMPKAEAEGVCLRVSTTDRGIGLGLQRVGKPAATELGVVASIHGVVKQVSTLQPATQSHIDIPADSLQTGVVQITVYDQEGRVWADRLAFFDKGDLQQQRIQIHGLNPDGYAAYAPVSLNLQGQPDATVSLAVRDNASSTFTFDTSNILTELLLCSQIRGYVEQPEYFFESRDQEHQHALDLLLMVQGWRRYKWVEMALPNGFSLTQPYEHTEWLYGQVSNYHTVEKEDQLTVASRKALEDAKMDVDAETRKADKDAKQAARNEKQRKGEENEDGKSTQQLRENREERDVQDRQQHRLGIQNNGEVARQRFLNNEGNLKREVRVRAEFVQPGTENSMVAGDLVTSGKGLFRIQAPRFYEACYFFFEASDTTKWKNGQQPIWIAPSEDRNERVEYPEFFVRLRRQFPRFVKPYTFYQNHLPMRGRQGGRSINLDNMVVMKEVTVGARHGGSRGFDPTQPALVVDAYEAFNEVVDAGLCPGYFIGGERFTYDVARTYIGDMNQERNYELERRFNGKPTSFNIPQAVREHYNHLPRLNKVYIYTDYCPRLEGDPKYTLSNQPEVIIDLHRYDDNSQRYVYRNRRMVLTGFSVPDEFYHPSYEKKPLGPPKDYRRTLYWNPELKLDAQGKAEVRFYNNARHTLMDVSAEGMTPAGQPLSGQLYSDAAK